MSYIDEESSLSPRRVVAGIGGVVVLFLVSMGIRAGSASEGGLLPQGVFGRTVTAEQIAAELEREPQLRRMTAAFRAHYPREFEDLLGRLADTANARGQQAANSEAFFFMQRFMTAKAEFIARAPSADLRRLAATTLDLLQTLQRADLVLCGRVVMEGFRPGEQPPPQAVRPLMQLVTLQLRAARTAEDGDSVDRGPLSDADGSAWFERLRQIDPASATLIDSNRLDAATAPQKCAAGISIYRATLDLPQEQSANVMAQLVRDAFAAAG